MYYVEHGSALSFAPAMHTSALQKVSFERGRSRGREHRTGGSHQGDTQRPNPGMSFTPQRTERQQRLDQYRLTRSPGL